MLYGLTKIGVLGGHGDGSNAIPAQYATTDELKAYREGTVMRRLAEALAELPGVVNLRPEADNITYMQRAQRLSEAGCDLGVDLHTNWSVNSKGVPNSGIMVVIVPMYNPIHDTAAQKAMATQLFQPLAEAMGFSFTLRTRKGSGEWDYYSFLNECNKKSVPYPMIVEHGYHIDFASDVEGNIARVRERYAQIVEATVMKTYYRVNAGEFATAAQAAAALDDVKANGYKGVVTRYPRVQVGSFLDRGNADKLLGQLQQSGYEHAYISIYDKTE